MLTLPRPVVAAPLTASLPGAPLPEPLPDLAYRGTLAPETEFVLLGARTRLEGARRLRWEKLLMGKWRGARAPAGLSSAGLSSEGLSPALDWEAVMSLASAHRVLGLLGRHLSARSWQNVPAPVKAALQHYFMGVARHTQALQSELARISALLENAGVPVVSFKGPTLALVAYGNAVVRPSGDLDLLVAREHALRAREILQTAGYTPEVVLSPAQDQIALRVDSVFNLHRPAPPALQGVLTQGYAVELHWAITSPCLPFDLQYETLAPQLSWIELPGVAPSEATSRRVRAIAPEDLLLILCVHGAKHLWERLIWLCDLAELTQATPDLNWARVLELARQRGVQRMTALGLKLMHDVLGAPLPREVQAWLSTQPEALRLASKLRHGLLLPGDQNAAEPGQLAGHVLAADALLMQTIDDRQHRLGFLWHLATVPTLGDRAKLELPPGLDFLWLLLRPARAVQKRLLPPKTAT